jgi:hypothetical protein
VDGLNLGKYLFELRDKATGTVIYSRGLSPLYYEWDEQKLLSSMPHAGKVGAFDGALYESRGLYRPEGDCIMFTRTRAGFCRVCRRAIARIIDLHSE